ncbi:hypothetical protein [Streptomyces sp. NPDC003077]|uniref:hypothetical protein n=1 Tax=Streptomyces sp. NPDC003077 TaxID=3154443 RepID=UPI0033AEF0E1
MTEAEAREAVGVLVEEVTTGRTGILQDAFAWECPDTRAVAFTVFVRPVGGGCEWTACPEDIRKFGAGARRGKG